MAEMDGELKRFIKWQLGHYPVDRRRLRDHAALKGELGRSGLGTPGEERYYTELERTLRAVDAALDRLPEEDRALIDLVFMKKSHSVDGAAGALNYSRSAAYRHIDSALTEIARELGYLPERI